MKTFQIRDGKVTIDGVHYSQSPSDVDVRGLMGRIHSINISGRGQFFPIGGFFDDGSVKVVDSTTDVLEPTTKETKKRAKKGSK